MRSCVYGLLKEVAKRYPLFVDLGEATPPAVMRHPRAWCCFSHGLFPRGPALSVVLCSCVCHGHDWIRAGVRPNARTVDVANCLQTVNPRLGRVPRLFLADRRGIWF